MSVADFKNKIVPELTAFLGKPVIEADHVADAPKGPHMTYKVTTPYAAGVGMPDTITEASEDALLTHHVEQYRATVSLTAYAFDDVQNGLYGLAEQLAQQARDWFDFYGQNILSQNNLVVIELTSVENRDAILVENYERRNGFDAIIRMSRKLTRTDDYFNDAAIEYKEE